MGAEDPISLAALISLRRTRVILPREEAEEAGTPAGEYKIISGPTERTIPISTADGRVEETYTYPAVKVQRPDGQTVLVDARDERFT